MTGGRDAELSALLDGALPAHEEAALRAELARDPKLAARLAELAQVDAALRALPTRAAPADLRARLQAKIDAEAQGRPLQMAGRRAAPAPQSGRRAWLAGFTAAVAAAAAALVVLVVEPPGDGADRAAAPSGLAKATSPAESLAPELAGAPSALGRVSVESAPAAPPHPAASAFPGSPDPARLAAASGERGQPHDGPGAASAPSAALAPEATSLAAGSSLAAASGVPTVELAPEAALEVAVTPAAEPLLVELTDAEAAALGELEPSDADVVAVLDWLGELDALEAGAS